MSVHFWGENPIGRWHLEIEYIEFVGRVRMTSPKFILYGTQTNVVHKSDIRT